MSDINLQEKFPNMTPISGSPTLFRINGCGLAVYGKRDYDRETRTYVKTYCLCFLFIPIFPICAYRVADANGGWYFIGKEPLSNFARIFNYVVLSSVVVGIGYGAWLSHTQSPEAKAAALVEKAESAEASGKLMEAAQHYVTVAGGSTSHAVPAAGKLFRLAESKIPTLSPKECVDLLTMFRRVRLDLAGKNKLNALAVTRIKALQDSDPRGALNLLEAINGAPSDAAAHAQLRENLLERILAKDSGDVDAASELAVIYEGRKEAGKCETVLAPVAKKLGSTEGARILGQIFFNQGKTEQAFNLLSPYTEQRLKRLHDAEKAYNAASEACWNNSLQGLRAGRGPDSFYREIERLSEDEKSIKVDAYLAAQLRINPRVKAAQEVLAKEAAVVPVALDLGILRLHRAQGMAGPEERRKELEAAEKVFLSIRGVAGETDEYRLYYGQVSYWLGKHEEGKKLFDELLASKNRSFEILIEVSRPLREVGAQSEARALMEEAYNKALDQDKKYRAANMRASTNTDLDDHITWLNRANKNDLEIAASLDKSLGQKALMLGNETLAADHLRKSMAAYSKLPENTVTLNNGALAAFTLYAITREPSDFQKGLGMQSEAVRLAPSNSILLSNLTYLYIQDAAIGTIGNEIDFKVLKLNPQMEMLSFLYTDEQSRQKYVERFMAQPSCRKAASAYERLLVLAPKNYSNYESVYRLYRYFGDLEKLHEIDARLKNVELDGADAAEQLKSYTKEDDPEREKQLDAMIKKYDSVLAATGITKRSTAIASVYMGTALLARKKENLDLDNALKFVEQGHAADSSSFTRNALSDTLLFRASKTIAKQDAEYKALEEKLNRALGARQLLAFAVLKPGKLRDAIIANPDVRRALVLLKEDGKAFPSRRDYWEWAFFSVVDPLEAAAIASSLNTDFQRTCLAIERALEPVSASVAMDLFFDCLRRGDEKAAWIVIDEFAKRGVPLPARP